MADNASVQKTELSELDPQLRKTRMMTAEELACCDEGATFIVYRDSDHNDPTTGSSSLSHVDSDHHTILSPDRDALDSRCGFIPGYSIVGSIGHGGMGVVYQAIQERLQRVVALKVLKPSRHGNPEFIERFEREAMAIAKLNHPNIVTAYDYGEAEGKFYLAIEYVEGLDGAELIIQKSRLAEREAISLIRDAVLGLSHALSHGIIHRDVKPANLMLTSDTYCDASGGAMSGRLKVTDLGLAQIRENAQELYKESIDHGKIVGTPCYMAPEQARGEIVDFRGDIYALGATLYHFVTGRKPFDDDNPFAIIKNKLNTKLVHPQDIDEELSANLCLVLDRMLAKNRQLRYQSYEELLVDLQVLIIGCKPATMAIAEEESSVEKPRKRHFRLLRKKIASKTPAAFRLRQIGTPRRQRKLWKRALSYLIPLALGFALAH